MTVEHVHFASQRSIDEDLADMRLRNELEFWKSRHTQQRASLERLCNGLQAGDIVALHVGDTSIRVVAQLEVPK